MEYARRRPKLISFGCWLLLATISLLLIISSLFQPAHALTLSSARDCDDNAVLRCGALTTAELQQKYHGTGVVGIFNRFGITSSDISSSGTTAVSGQVTRSGQVFIDNQISGCGTFNNRLVATNAITAGRKDMENASGSSTKVMAGGVAFYERPPSVSFNSSPLSAFVFMKNCQFSSAILASCGNPVRATPVAKPVTPPTQAPQPAPSPPAPTPPAPTPPQTPAPTPPPQEITKAGPAQVLGLGILATAFGAAGHFFYLRRKSI